MPNAPFNDSSLSFEARGLLAYLLVKPDDWSVSITNIRQSGNIGRNAAYRLVGELIAAGYIVRDQPRTRRGARAVTYTVYDTPQTNAPASQLPGNGEAVDASFPETQHPGFGEAALYSLPKNEKAPKDLYSEDEPTSGSATRKTRKPAPAPESRPGPFADVWGALARIRRLNPEVCSDAERSNLRRLASAITRAGITDAATVEGWGRQWYAGMARKLNRPMREIDPPSVRQLTDFMGALLPRPSDPSAPTILDEDAIRARWPGLTFIAPNGRLSVKSPHALACEGKVERDSYDYLDRSTWPADVRECVAAVAALHGQAVHA